MCACGGGGGVCMWWDVCVNGCGVGCVCVCVVVVGCVYVV